MPLPSFHSSVLAATPPPSWPLESSVLSCLSPLFQLSCGLIVSVVSRSWQLVLLVWVFVISLSLLSLPGTSTNLTHTPLLAGLLSAWSGFSLFTLDVSLSGSVFVTILTLLDSWGPCAWIIIAEIWPLSTRPYGVALGASSNWM